MGRGTTVLLAVFAEMVAGAAPGVAQAGTPAATAPATLDTVSSQVEAFRVEEVARGVEVPSGLSFLPDGRGILTERPSGRLSLFGPDGGDLVRVRGVPRVFGLSDAGLHEAVPHPDFARNRWLYFSYSVGDSTASTLVVDRARLEGDSLVGRERIFEARPHRQQPVHYGGRLVFHDGYVFITVGDRDHRDDAQDLSAHNGKVLRLHDDGRVPDDNPFVDTPGAAPEVWSWGHRHPQGLARHPGTGELWLHEHGPRGGDEINLVRPGRNYGWPLVSYGGEYAGGPVGRGLARRAGLEEPVWFYRPSIGPSGMFFYDGSAFPAWSGSLFVGAMALQHLGRLDIAEGRVLHEERLLTDRGWRVRSLAQAPDGTIYLGTDFGLVVRLRPR